MNKKFAQGIIIGAIITILITSGLIEMNVLAVSSAAKDGPVALSAHAHASDDGHLHSAAVTVTENVPTIEIEAFEDPVAGFNIHIKVTNFEFAPLQAGREHVDGEGHAHLYVDEVKMGRVYGEWVHVGGLEAGLHQIKVVLNANTHAVLMANGREIADSVIVVVE